MMPDQAAELYLERALDQMPRSISLQDRESFSRTYGGFDRVYWAWKFVDFPGARYQEGVYPLAYVHSVADGGQGYLGNRKVLEWIEAGLGYWAGIQRGDGSYDEAYPWEHSLAATAFTGFYISEAFRLVRGSISAETRDRVGRSLVRVGEWLTRNDETHGFLTNHLAAAAGALIHIGQLFDERRFVDRGWYFIDRIFGRQSREGWYDEYGGADPGYQTHGTFYLARCWELTGDGRLADSLDRSVEFLAHFVHVDGTLGGEYGSRSTQFYYPAGMEMLVSRSEAARWVAERMAESIRHRRVASLETMDAQNFYPLLNNYLFAHSAAVRRGREGVAFPAARTEAPMVVFPDAGLIKVNRPRYEMIVGASKGGVIKVFDRQGARLVYSDCGYVGRLGNGRLIASQALDRERPVAVGEGAIGMEVPFYAVKRTVFRPLTFVVFRLVNMTLGRWPKIGYWIKSLLVKVLIYRRSAVPLWLKRKIVVGEDFVEIVDGLRADGGLDVVELKRADVFSTVHMGSSRYFQRNELDLGQSEAMAAGDPVLKGALNQGIELRRMVGFSGEPAQTS